MNRKRTFTSAAAVASLAALGLLVGAADANASRRSVLPPDANAYVLQADALGNLAAVAPTPLSACPPGVGSTQTLLGLNAGPFATASLLTAQTGCSIAAGTSNSSATVADVTADLAQVLAGTSLHVTGVNSTCTAPALPGQPSGTGTIASGTVSLLGLPAITLQANASPNTIVTIANVGTLVLNEQTRTGNTLSVNAVHLTVLGTGANVIIGHADCEGAPPTPPVPMMTTPTAVGGGAAAAAATAGVALLRRRRTTLS
ncbi:choice-of-anchor P family protein [Streptacidiphilus sp. EB129]|uniref:choice-of-anchor P family protein n=1 Tax=Streptacidiphilus sp. EB129 TaxID=3156262 RepID=UPI00351670EF